MPNHLTTQKYWNICGFLNDEEILKVYDIIDNALDRKGWVGLADNGELSIRIYDCLLYTSPSPRDPKTSRMPSSA